MNPWWAWPVAIAAVIPGMVFGLLVCWIILAALVAAV